MLTILIGSAAGTVWFFVQRHHTTDGYNEYRRLLGKIIILGLEFLIAGDIIRTVAVSHTLEGGDGFGHHRTHPCIPDHDAGVRHRAVAGRGVVKGIRKEQRCE